MSNPDQPPQTSGDYPIAQPQLLDFEDGFVMNGYSEPQTRVPLFSEAFSNPYAANSFVRVKTELDGQPNIFALGSSLAVDVTATQERGQGKIRGSLLSAGEQLAEPVIGEEWSIPGLGNVGRVSNVMVLLGRSRSNKYGMQSRRAPFDVASARHIPEITGTGEANDLLIELGKRLEAHQ